jgi:hypothetical protein
MVSGIYCAVDCNDPSHLAFIDRGTLTPEGLRFQVLRIERGVQSRTDVTGRIVDDRLLLTLTPPRRRMKSPTQLILQRDPGKPAPVTIDEVYHFRYQPRGLGPRYRIRAICQSRHRHVVPP